MTGETDPPEPTEAEIDAVLAESGGDGQAAIAVLLHDLALLAVDCGAHVSGGLVRGEPPKLRVVLVQ